MVLPDGNVLLHFGTLATHYKILYFGRKSNNGGLINKPWLLQHFIWTIYYIKHKSGLHRTESTNKWIWSMINLLVHSGFYDIFFSLWNYLIITFSEFFIWMIFHLPVNIKQAFHCFRHSVVHRVLRLPPQLLWVVMWQTYGRLWMLQMYWILRL